MRMFNDCFTAIAEIKIITDDTFMSSTFDRVSSTAITDIILMDLFFCVFLSFFLSWFNFTFLDNFFLDLRNDMWNHFLNFFRDRVIKVNNGLFLFNFLFYWFFFLGFLLDQDLLSFIEEGLFTFMNLHFNLINS